mmetsp:Transcript_22348/g.41623  ORF Transcript_22348/g.41623 Transcript_22348/m.41623 type:complete len:318 (+) Transcript_22348:134-1087(+)
MEDGDDPYEVLGVSKTATEIEIKKSYRKLALQHHPDKQSTEEGRQRATQIFAKISNAYEILSDPQKRQEYDMGGTRQQQRDYYDGRGASHDFFGHHQHPFHFHDPFEVFNRVFREEFARHNAAMHGAPGAGFGSFQDPFFASPFPSMMGGSLFDDDPFFGGMGRRGRGGGGDPFFGGNDPFAMMQQSMMGGMNNMNGTSSTFVQSISSSGNYGGGGGGASSVSTSTTTRIVNGRRQTVTETIIQKPDGTVERKVQTDGDMGMLDQQQQAPDPSRRRLTGSRRHSRTPQLTNGDQEHEQPQPEAAPDRKKQKKRRHWF